jgi:hypothetical protein
MRTLLLIAVVITTVLFQSVLTIKKGILGIDEINFDKIVDGSRNVLVEIVEYSWKATNVMFVTTHTHTHTSTHMYIHIQTKHTLP